MRKHFSWLFLLVAVFFSFGCEPKPATSAESGITPSGEKDKGTVTTTTVRGEGSTTTTTIK